MSFRKSCDRITPVRVCVCVCVCLTLLLLFNFPSLFRNCEATLTLGSVHCLSFYVFFLSSSGLAWGLVWLLMMKCGRAGSREPM